MIVIGVANIDTNYGKSKIGIRLASKKLQAPSHGSVARLKPSREVASLKSKGSKKERINTHEERQAFKVLESTFDDRAAIPTKSSNSIQKIGLDVGQNNPAEIGAIPGKVDQPAGIEQLGIQSNLKYAKLQLPLVILPVQTSKTDSAGPNAADRNPASSWKPSILVNVSGTNTSQSVYLLPSAHSRILKVSFPNSLANLGYKIGFGLQLKGYQFLINYSQLQYQTEYVYALDEFTVQASDSNYSFKRLGASRTVKSTFKILGIAAKKNFDFQTKLLGPLYAQFGLEYSHSVIGQQQQLLSASLSAGKKIFASPKAVVLIGPFYDYNMLRISTMEENVKIRPNQVGISLGIKFTR